MVLVVASIGSDGLLGMEALQACLPHQLDLWTGQLWTEGRSTLQLHQQRQASRTLAHLTTSVVLPPDSEAVAPVTVCSPSGIRLGPCSLVEPCIALTEDYGVLVGRTLLDASSLSASVLMVNPSSEVVVLPYFLCVGDGVGGVRSSIGTGASGDGWTSPGPPGGYSGGIAPFLGRGRSVVTQEHIASVCPCISGSRGACDGADYVGPARDCDYGRSADSFADLGVLLQPVSEPNRHVLRKRWKVVRLTVHGHPR